MQNLFRLRIEAGEAAENQTLTFVDAGELERETALAVLVQWQDRTLKPALEALFQDFVREYRDSGSIVSPGSFLERLVHSLDATFADLQPDRVDEFEVGVVLCCGRGLYVLHSSGLETRYSTGSAALPLQSSMRVRVKDLSPGSMRQSHLWSERVVDRLRLVRVFFEDEDRALLWLAPRGEALQGEGLPGQGLEPEGVRGLTALPADVAARAGAKIVVTKELAEAGDLVANAAGNDSGWPDLNEAPRRDRRSASYATLGLVALLFGMAIFGIWRWQRLGSHMPPHSGSEALLSETPDSSLEPKGESPRVSPEVVDASPVAGAKDAATVETPASAPSPGALQVVWQKRHTNWVTSSPRLAKGRVVYGCRDGHLYAVDPGGEQRWDYDSRAGIGASPAVDDDRVFCGNYAGRAFAIKAKDGTEIWSADLGSRVVAGPSYDGKLVFFATFGGDLVALKKKDGQVQWRRPLGGKLRATPLVNGDGLYVPAGAHDVVCLKPSSGEVRWTYAAAGEVHSSPLFADGRVVFGCKDGSIYALSAKDGSLLWRTRTKGAVEAAPALGGDLVYAGSSDKRLYAIRVQTGEIAWKFPAQATILSTPCVQDGKVYFTAYDRNTYVLDAASGKPLAKTKLGAPIFSSPLVVDGRVYCGSNDGTVYCMTAMR